MSDGTRKAAAAAPVTARKPERRWGSGCDRCAPTPTEPSATVNTRTAGVLHVIRVCSSSNPSQLGHIRFYRLEIKRTRDREAQRCAREGTSGQCRVAQQLFSERNCERTTRHRVANALDAIRLHAQGTGSLYQGRGRHDTPRRRARNRHHSFNHRLTTFATRSESKHTPRAR